jgi:hypothetical protein
MNAIGASVLERVQKLYNMRFLPHSRVKSSETLEDIQFLAQRCAFRLDNFQCNISTETDEIQMVFSVDKTSKPFHAIVSQPYGRKTTKSELIDDPVLRRSA